MNSSILSASSQQDEAHLMKNPSRSSLMSRSRIFSLPPDSVYNSIVEKNSFLSLNLKEKGFAITQVSRDFLASLTGRLYVVSVSGAPLAGKSTILNLMMSILTHHIEEQEQEQVNLEDDDDNRTIYTNIFKVGDGNRRTTDGLDYFCVKSGNDHILFLDLEGDNDPVRKDTGVWIYSNLVTTALAASHIHMYNYTNYAAQSFLKYFDSISKIITQNKLHPEFNPQMYLVKKDHNVMDPNDLMNDRNDISESLKEHFQECGLEYFVYLMNTPPEHLINKRCKTSCIKLHGNVCEQCLQSSYIKAVKDLTLTIYNRVKTMPAYNSGLEFLELVDKVLEINKRDLPYVVDMGCIAKIREARFNKEQLRIKHGISESHGFALDKEFSQQIQKLLTDQDGLVDVDLVQHFDKTLNQVLLKLAQSDYLLLELSKFLEESLLDDSFTVLNEREMEQILQIYVYPFQSTLKEALKAFLVYKDLLASVDGKLEPVREDVHKHLREFVRASSDYKSKSMVLGVQGGTAIALNLIAREAAIRAFALGFGGVGILVGIVAVIAYVRVSKRFAAAKQKNDKLVNIQSVPGIYQAENEKDQMALVEDYLNKTTVSIQSKNNMMEEMLESGEMPDEDRLTGKITKMLMMKSKGEEYNEYDKEDLKKLFEKVKEKVETLKMCI